MHLRCFFLNKNCVKFLVRKSGCVIFLTNLKSFRCYQIRTSNSSPYIWRIKAIKRCNFFQVKCDQALLCKFPELSWVALCYIDGVDISFLSWGTLHRWSKRILEIHASHLSLLWRPLPLHDSSNEILHYSNIKLCANIAKALRTQALTTLTKSTIQKIAHPLLETCNFVHIAQINEYSLTHVYDCFNSWGW